MSKILSKKVMVVGLGYVGLSSAAVIAENGFDVLGYDINEFAVSQINNGKVHIDEDGLETLVRKVVKSDKLRAVTSSIKQIFLSLRFRHLLLVKKADISYVISSINAIAPFLKKGDLVILESTSPVGTTKKICKLIARLRPELNCPSEGKQYSDINIAYSPERILPGQTIKELVSNSRVVGGISEICSEKANEFYKSFVKGSIFTTTSSTAEMCKLAENSYRDVNIAFANELSMICEEDGIDVRKSKYSNYHPRVDILSPGCGVGGHCIPIDPWFLVEKYTSKTALIHSARKVNQYKPLWVLKNIIKKVDEYKTAHKIENINLSILGISYKPDSDDLRESPALEIAKELIELTDYNISVIDPNISELPQNINILRLVDQDEGLKNVNVLVELVSHSAFKNIDTRDCLYLKF